MSLKKIFIISLIVKLLVAALLPLSFDEAYYWVWSHNLQLSYFDHPPFVSWLLWLGHSLENLGGAVRWPAVVLGHSILLIWAKILQPFVSSDHIKKIWWAILITPFLGFGSLIVTPDLPVLFFWTLSIYLVLICLEKPSWINYASLGCTLGLGFCSKYHIVLIVPFIILGLVFTKQINKIKWHYLPIIAFTGLLFSMPVILWNFQNDFASFKFQLNHGLHGIGWTPQWTMDYILSQLLLVSPFIWWSYYKANIPNPIKLISWIAALPFAFFLYTSTKGHVEANWPIIGYSSLIVCASFAQSSSRYFKWNRWFWSLIYALIGIAILIPPLRTKIEKLNEPFVFSQITSEVNDYKPLFATTYQMASSMWFYTKEPVYKLKGIGRFDYFDNFKVSAQDYSKFFLLKYSNQTIPNKIFEFDYQKRLIKKLPSDLELWEYSR